MEQTAVEWLVSQLNKQGFAQVVTDEEIEQAKEMEKQMVIYFAKKVLYEKLGWDCLSDCFCIEDVRFVDEDSDYKISPIIEQYYNETFKNK